MRFDGNGLVYYSDDEIRQMAAKGSFDDHNKSETKRAAKEWVKRKWTPPKVGDRFMDGVEEYMLVQSLYSGGPSGVVGCALVQCNTGRAWREPEHVLNIRALTRNEWKVIQGCGEFIPVETDNG